LSAVAATVTQPHGHCAHTLSHTVAMYTLNVTPPLCTHSQSHCHTVTVYTGTDTATLSLSHKSTRASGSVSAVKTLK
jgi:hypothetical protein